MALEPVRLVTYARSGVASMGMLDDDVLWDLPGAYDAHAAAGRASASLPAHLPESMRGFIALGVPGVDAALEAVSSLRDRGQDEARGRRLRLALEDVSLLPPVPDPPKILCMGLIFQTHAVATGQELPKQPQIFMKPCTGLVGHGGSVILPRAWPDKVVPGTELCVVIGRTAHLVDEDDAFACVYGYTVLNDVTARGFPFPKNKMFDTHAPVGPCLRPATSAARSA
jgi:2-keto-4-pentenoate hydratase/2-oxohepta-3-ene-1,7-dioic acid hydratase in catechol pathway